MHTNHTPPIVRYNRMNDFMSPPTSLFIVLVVKALNKTPVAQGGAKVPQQQRQGAQTRTTVSKTQQQPHNNHTTTNKNQQEPTRTKQEPNKNQQEPTRTNNNQQQQQPTTTNNNNQHWVFLCLHKTIRTHIKIFPGKCSWS